MALILFSFVLALLVLFYASRDGRIHPDARTSTMVILFDMYLPLLALMAAFYFAGVPTEPNREKSLTLQIFVFSLTVVAIWVLTPIGLLVSSMTIERIHEVLSKYRSFGDTAAVGAVAYLFAKSG